MKTIYAMIDPRTNEPYYVGATQNPGRRMLEHLGNTQIQGQATPCLKLERELKSLELRPEMRVLEVVEEKDWQEAEQKWIRHGQQNGWPLTNQTDGGLGFSGTAEARQYRTARWLQFFRSWKRT